MQLIQLDNRQDYDEINRDNFIIFKIRFHKLKIL